MEIVGAVVFVIVFLLWLFKDFFGSTAEKYAAAADDNVEVVVEQEVVGESFHADTLNEAMAGVAADGEGWQERRAEFTMRWEPDNPHDRLAIAVLWDGRKVGHIPKADIRQYRQEFGGKALLQGISVPGRIVGKEGRYGITLDIDL